jgi:hypothetical protein
MTELITVPERNRAIKKLLEKTYGKGCASVRAGDGTAYRWVQINFFEKPEALRKAPYGHMVDALETLIRGAGIYLSTFPDDMGGPPHTCLALSFKAKRT